MKEQKKYHKCGDIWPNLISYTDYTNEWH